MSDYEMIFKRKSFHIFHNIEPLTEDDLKEVQKIIDSVTPLDDTIRVKMKLVPSAQTQNRSKPEYCIEFFSEVKGEYLRNIGYIGEQIDLRLAERNIGGLWLGLGRPDVEAEDGLAYVIMIGIGKLTEDRFRTDMFKAKRKPLEEGWQGDTLGVGEIVRFTPSACNGQPWISVNDGNQISVYRYKKPGRTGMIPLELTRYYNRIDIGIYLYMLEVCLQHEGYNYTRRMVDEIVPDQVPEGEEQVLVAEYGFAEEN